jgi:hypothetical protein
MPKLKPLEEWICDTCGELTGIDEGWVEWLGPIGKGPHSFRIVHNRHKCQQHTKHPDRADNHLERFLGAPGLQTFLAYLDIGPILDPKGKGEPQPEMASFVDTVRRLHIPYYEEARTYLSEARADGYFDDQNENSVYMPRTCEAMIRRYES